MVASVQIVTDPVRMFHKALTDAGIPIGGVAVLDPANLTGGHIVTRPDGLVVRIDYLPEATPDQIIQGDHIVMTLDVSPIQARSVWDIYADVKLLAGADLLAIWNDLRANNNARLHSVGPPQDGSMLVLHWCSTNLNGATLAEKNDANARIIALYTQQNMRYLEHPSFAPNVNVPGWEYVPA